MPGGDVDVVSDALGLDSRIGRKYLTGGLGFGGPCFPRDNVALGFIATRTGSPRRSARHDRSAESIAGGPPADAIRPARHARHDVAVLGLAYKPFSHVTEESQAIMIVKAFLEHGVRVLAYDPLAAAERRVSSSAGGR